MTRLSSFGAADLLELREIRCLVRIGVTEEERSTLQPLEISVVIATDVESVYSDDLSSTYDYSIAAAIVERLTSSTCEYLLMEYLAQCVVNAIMDSSDRVSGVEVAVRKLKPPVDLSLRDAGFVMMRRKGQS